MSMPSAPLLALNAPLALPSDIAATFALSVDHPAGPEAPVGRWVDQRYRGSFRLKGHEHVYRIACEHGRWVVE